MKAPACGLCLWSWLVATVGFGFWQLPGSTVPACPCLQFPLVRPPLLPPGWRSGWGPGREDESVTVPQGLLGPSVTCRLSPSTGMCYCPSQSSRGPSLRLPVHVSHMVAPRPAAWATGPSRVLSASTPVFSWAHSGRPSPLHPHRCPVGPVLPPFSGTETEAQRGQG